MPLFTAELDGAPVITAEIVAVAMQGVISFEGVESVGADPAMHGSFRVVFFG